MWKIFSAGSIVKGAPEAGTTLITSGLLHKVDSAAITIASSGQLNATGTVDIVSGSIALSGSLSSTTTTLNGSAAANSKITVSDGTINSNVVVEKGTVEIVANKSLTMGSRKTFSLDASGSTLANAVLSAAGAGASFSGDVSVTAGTIDTVNGALEIKGALVAAAASSAVTSTNANAITVDSIDLSKGNLTVGGNSTYTVALENKNSTYIKGSNKQLINSGSTVDFEGTEGKKYTSTSSISFSADASTVKYNGGDFTLKEFIVDSDDAGVTLGTTGENLIIGADNGDKTSLTVTTLKVTSVGAANGSKLKITIGSGSAVTGSSLVASKTYVTGSGANATASLEVTLGSGGSFNAGALEIGSGAAADDASTMTVAGADDTENVFTASTVTIKKDGKLTIGDNNNKTISANFTGAVTIEASNSAGNGGLLISGNATVTAEKKITSAGQIIITGSGSADTPGDGAGILIANDGLELNGENSLLKAATGTAKVSGDVTVTAGTIQTSGANTLVIDGTLGVNSNAVLDLDTTNKLIVNALNIAGNVNFNGKLCPTKSTYYYNLKIDNFVIYNNL